MTPSPQQTAQPSLAGRLIRGLNPVKRPKLVLGVLAAVAAFGVYLGTQLPDFNLGAGGGGSIGLFGGAGDNTAVLPSDSHPATPEDVRDKKAGGPLAARTEVLDIVVDGSGYALRQRDGSADEFVPTPLADVIALAKEMPGNRDGIRVRVYRRGSALPSAEEALQQALEEANVGESAVQMIDGVLE